MKKKFKILLVTTYVIPAIRSEFITHIPVRIRYLLGPNVEFKFCYVGDVNEELLNKKKIETIKYRDKKNFSKIKYLFYLNKIIKKYKPNVVMNMVSHKNSYLYAIPCILNGVKSVARVTGNVFHSQHKIFFYKRLGEFISLFLVNKIICLSKHLVYNTPSKFFSKKVNVLSPGINCSRIKKYQIINRKKTIDLLYVGRFEEVKNLKLAFSVFNKLLKKNKNINFTLIGNGTLLKGFKQKYRKFKNIKFYGNLPHYKVAKYFKKSKFLILSSISEGFPNVILEAMLYGATPIVTKVSIMEEIIKNKNLGILLNVKNLKKSISLITNLIDHESKRKLFASRAFDYVKKKHDFNILQRNYKKVLFEK